LGYVTDSGDWNDLSLELGMNSSGVFGMANEFSEQREMWRNLPRWSIFWTEDELREELGSGSC